MTAKDTAGHMFTLGESRTVTVVWHGARLAVDRVETPEGPVYFLRNGVRIRGAVEVGTETE
jgi:hypothetical protein